MAAETDVLILGASFAGIEVLYQLVRFSEGQPPRVTVVDRMARHGYIPLVQERLVGRLPLGDSELDTAAYVRSVPEATFVEEEVVAFDVARKTATLASGAEIRGRCVVVALGSAAEPPPDLPGGGRLRSYKFGAEFEATRAALDDVLGGSEERPTIAVVGGGVSGVEMAGELADLRRARPEGWRVPEVVLVCGSERLVPGMPEVIAERCRRSLVAQGVAVRLGARVEAVHDGGLSLQECRDEVSDRVELPAALSLWSAGVRPSSILPVLGLPLTAEGWLRVGPTLQCFPDAGAPKGEIFACGDAVRVVGGTGEWPTMQRAIECLWQAKVVARNLLALLRQPAGDSQGWPSLRPHRLRRDFFYGVSLGRDSLVVYGRHALNVRGVNHAFRRWLMRQYFARYAPIRGALAAAPR